MVYATTLSVQCAKRRVINERAERSAYGLTSQFTRVLAWTESIKTLKLYLTLARRDVPGLRPPVRDYNGSCVRVF